MNLLCLDLEGVLVPEIWVAVADATGIAELRKTTRDVPVYDDLMGLRLGILRERNVDFATVDRVIGRLEPLPGAADFLAWARRRFQVAVISDTFYEFAQRLMAKLGYPLLLCHRLEIEAGRIVGYRLRQADPKRSAVRAFKALQYRVVAVGDSFNDVSMLEEADPGVFFRAPENVTRQFPQFACAGSYEALQRLLEPHA